MNRLAIAAIALFGGLFLIFFILSISSIVSLSRISGEEADGEPARYHFALFLPRESHGFFNSVVRGAEEAAQEYGCALSLHPVGNGNLDLEMARFSGIDGAILYPNIDEDEARRILEQLKASGISAVLVEHSLSDESPWPLVGTNSFDIGKKIGELISSREGGPLRAAVVYSEKSPGIYTEKDLVGLGITSVLEKRLDAPLSVRVTDLNPLDAEELTYRILRNEPEITTIIFTDTRDTLAATQVLIDMNLVGTVQLVGFGSDEAILDYVEKGILTAAVVTNPYGIGYKAVEMLMELERFGNASAYVDTGFVIVTADNLDEYRKEGERQ
jgi:ABC-type sugar transport system substrate-binding protein